MSEIESERIPLPVAAKILGMSQQGVREHMKLNLFENSIGEVTKPNGPGGRHQYHIYRDKLNYHIGKVNAAKTKPEE